MRGSSSSQPQGDCTYTGALLQERAEQLLAAHAEDISPPLFLYYAASNPHWPLAAPPEYIERCRGVRSPHESCSPHDRSMSSVLDQDTPMSANVVCSRIAVEMISAIAF